MGNLELLLNFDIEIVTISGSPQKFKEILCEKLKGKVFHITSREGFEGIKENGAILHSNHEKVIKKIWGNNNSMSYFRRRNCISVCDFHNNTDRKELIKAIKKYRCFDPNAVVKNHVSYILVLNKSLYCKLISWRVWKNEQAYSEQIVPYLESGIKNKILLSDIDTIIELISDEE